MGFASTYLETKVLFPVLIKEPPAKATGIIVVVPAFDEPEITELLDSLASCSEPECSIEIIIIVNAPLNASQISLENNKKSLQNIESWKRQNTDCFFRLSFLDMGQPSINDWGVGLARKTGMDEAVRRFDLIDNPNGIIVNLDADCRVQENYFLSISSELLVRNDRKACSVYFEHPLAGNDYPEEVYAAVTQYELHMRYYFQALRFSGYPYVFHTVGSTIAVKSIEYIKIGGMNRRKAGEDFYFIQKLVPSGGYFNLYSTTVYPSPRASSRVPFGTGPVIGRMVSDGVSSFLTYNPLAFKDLHSFLSLIGRLYFCKEEEWDGFYLNLPQSLKSFISETEWITKLSEIRNNTSGLLSFTKRFYNWFTMFKVVKYLNHVHQLLFNKVPVDLAAAELLKYIGLEYYSENPYELLLCYRLLEKNSQIFTFSDSGLPSE
jgi:hypothetical protein